MGLALGLWGWGSGGAAGRAGRGWWLDETGSAPVENTADWVQLLPLDRTAAVVKEGAAHTDR